MLTIQRTLILVVLSVSPTAATEPAMVNGDFEMDHGPFSIPSGWVPFGLAKYEGRVVSGDWKLQIADLHARQEGGLYQAMIDLPAKTRWRLAADVKAGSPQLPVRIGLLPIPASGPQTIVWSAEHTGSEWTRLHVEADATSSSMLVILQMRNLNSEYQLLEAGAFDNVTLSHAGASHAAPSSRPAATEIPPASDVYASLANLWSLAWPKPGVRTFLAGSHDPNPDGNADFDRVESRFEQDGQQWSVLKSFDGPGAIVRVWMTNFPRDSRMRIEIDGQNVWEDKVIEFFGSPGVSGWPLANQTSGGWMSYLPIPFARSARILATGIGQDRFYWQVTWQRFDSASAVRSFTWPLNPFESDYLATIRSQWAAASVNPKPPIPGTRDTSGTISIPAQDQCTILQANEPGIIDAIWIDHPSWDERTLRGLRLRATWDNAALPQVDVPAGLLFGCGYQYTITRALLTGIAPPDGGYCFFPMPFRTAARIELENQTDQAMANVRFRIRWAPLPVSRVSPMRCHIVQTTDPRAGQKQLFVPLNVRGQGHLAGISGVLACGNRKNNHFLEGDEYIWVDGESEPSTAGTGTEDYFTCGWYFNVGPITLPPVGAPEVNRKLYRVAAYRFHIPDWVPFDRSLKFGLEVGDSPRSDEYGVYDTAAFYYLAPKRSMQ